MAQYTTTCWRVRYTIFICMLLAHVTTQASESESEKIALLTDELKNKEIVVKELTTGNEKLTEEIKEIREELSLKEETITSLEKGIGVLKKDFLQRKHEFQRKSKVDEEIIDNLQVSLETCQSNQIHKKNKLSLDIEPTTNKLTPVPRERAKSEEMQQSLEAIKNENKNLSKRNSVLLDEAETVGKNKIRLEEEIKEKNKKIREQDAIIKGQDTHEAEVKAAMALHKKELENKILILQKGLQEADDVIILLQENQTNRSNTEHRVLGYPTIETGYTLTNLFNNSTDNANQFQRHTRTSSSQDSGLLASLNLSIKNDELETTPEKEILTLLDKKRGSITFDEQTANIFSAEESPGPKDHFFFASLVANAILLIALVFIITKKIATPKTKRFLITLKRG